MNARAHSIETFGTLDGPGIRFVLFLQGCAMQCLYCHNPDTWDVHAGRLMTVEEVLLEIEPYVDYYKRSGGGVTVTGGEPGLQAAFVTELFTLIKRRWNLHTALDTSGFCNPEWLDDMLAVTDLVLLDLKLMDEEKHIALTGQSNDRTLAMASLCSEKGVPMWVRHVLVPGWTDDEADLLQFGAYVQTLNHVEKVEVLPYHTMGVTKWAQLDKKYPLEGVQPPSADEMARAYTLIKCGRSHPGNPGMRLHL
jgi:pyruvate formate lyase activating enzyme